MKRYYYHITDKHWPKTITLIPQAEGENRDEDEPLIPRICVCSTIEQCMVAVYLYTCDVYSIYRTKEKITAKRAQCINDSYITDEHWVLKPTKFIKIGKIDFEQIGDREWDDFVQLGDGLEESEEWQKQSLHYLKQLHLSFLLQS